ncbi:MAG: preprotein translocase subunit Sec61beta [Candidatus Aenigmarchaeota archaeon]|nr:preprotein translocase subunit Sec61beta [Candidatus Aenigmarchaeota archaeon]
MAEKKQYMPQSTAGIMRYMDVEERLQIKPTLVVAVSLAFAAIVLVLKLFV